VAERCGWCGDGGGGRLRAVRGVAREADAANDGERRAVESNASSSSVCHKTTKN
jgi:hypothetical protein